MNELSSSRDYFGAVMKYLAEYSLIEPSPDGEIYSMDPKLHELTRRYFRHDSNDYGFWALDLVSRASSNTNDRGEGFVAQLLKHADVCRIESREYDLDIIPWSDQVQYSFMCNGLEASYDAQDRPVYALELFQRARASKEEALGPEHLSTVQSCNNRGLTYSKLDRWDEAEKMYELALTGREKASDSDPVLILAVVNHLGVLYSAQGRFDEAEQMYLRALTGHEKKVRAPDELADCDLVYNLAHLRSCWKW